MHITVLGSGSATPHRDRHQTALALTHHHKVLLFDCGEYTQYQLLKYGIRLNRISHIFISHLHGDHYLGLPGLVSTLNSLSRTASLCIVGPHGLQDILAENMRIQQTHLQFDIQFVPTSLMPLSAVAETTTLVVKSFPLQHRGQFCTGYLVSEKPGALRLIKERLPENISIAHLNSLKSGKDVLDHAGNILYSYQDYTHPPHPPKTFAYCTDTMYDPSIIPYIQGADMLYHEATFVDKHQSRAELTHHSTAAQAAQIALDAQAKKLLIGHFSARYDDLSPFEIESENIFPNTILAVEGTTYTV